MSSTQRQKKVTNLRNQCASIAPRFPRVRRQHHNELTQKVKFGLWSFLILVLLSFIGCAETTNTTTPEGAKQFLKLRGYEFDDKSFLTSAVRGDVMAVNAFLAAGMSPDVKDELRGETALIAAASRGDAPVAKALIDGGADVNVRSPTGANALLRALENKKDEVAALMLAQPSLDLNTQRADGTTALMIYAARGSEAQASQLLERGVARMDQQHQAAGQSLQMRMRGSLALQVRCICAITSLVGARARQRDEFGQVAVRSTIGRQQHQFCVRLAARGAKVNFTADNQMQAALLRLDMRTHDTGDRAGED